MANITLAGTLRDPNGDLAVGDKIRFTHKSTTGETVKSASSILTIDPTGVYSVDLEYGLVLVEYKDVRNSQFDNLGVATVNGTNPSTTIPELLNALVPVSSAELIEFQAILADCVAAKDAAEAAAASAVNRVIKYDTTILATTETNASIMFNGAALNIKERTAGDGISGMWDVVLASSVVVDGVDIIQCTGIASLAIKSREVPVDYDLFVIYGQSNAVGFAGGSAGSDGRVDIPKNAYFWQNRNALFGWQPLSYDMPFVSITTSTGHAWVEFARKYTERTGRGCLFLPAAFGGTSLSQLTVGTQYFDYLTTAINEIYADNTYTIRKTNMLWCQGESDMTDGTTESEYINGFNALWQGFEGVASGENHCIMSRIGTPRTRPETSRHQIQSAQDYLCSRFDDMSLGWDGASSLTIDGGTLTSDGTHYTQKGYNLMGAEMAKSAALIEDSTTNTTDFDAGRFRGLMTPPDQVHNALAATVNHNGSIWELQTVNGGGRYRASAVKSITVGATSIILETSVPTNEILYLDMALNNLAASHGLTATVRDGTTVNLLVIEFFADTQAIVDTVTGAITYPPFGGSVNTGILSDLSATVTGGGITQLSYTSHVTVPIVSQFMGGALDEFVAINQTAGSSNNIWFKYETIPTTTKALVTFRAKPVDPSALLLSGLSFTVHGIIGDRLV